MRLPGLRDESLGSSAARELLREAVQLGVNLIDIAHAYGGSEEMIAEAPHPFPRGLCAAFRFSWHAAFSRARQVRRTHAQRAIIGR
jgi:aryl-alcohol dehydrogenase-like predicted oxidoreductase